MSLKSRVAALEKRAGSGRGYIVVDLCDLSQGEASRKLAEARATATAEDKDLLVMVHKDQDVPE